MLKNIVSFLSLIFVCVSLTWGVNAGVDNAGNASGGFNIGSSKNDSFVYVKELSKGNQVGVAVDATTGAIKTIMNGSRIVKPRFKIIE